MNDKFLIIKNQADDIFHLLETHFDAFHNKSIFITGGTGFIGQWILELLQCAIDSGIKIEVTALTRSIDKFSKSSIRNIKDYNIKFIEGDIRNFDFTNFKFDYFIHGAVDASASLNENQPFLMFDTITDGCKNVIKGLSVNPGCKLLYLSSGAVYGNSNTNALFKETDVCSLNPEDTSLSYAVGKHASEFLFNTAASLYEVEVKIARIFSVYGPLIPLTTHFAIGNFINSALNGEQIVINGNGKPIRSSIYISDLIRALILIITTNNSYRVYNVGSENFYSIYELASCVNKLLGISGSKVEVLGKDQTGWNQGFYAPSIQRLRDQFDFNESFSLEDSIIYTADYYKGMQ